jgi:hypothetical protein
LAYEVVLLLFFFQDVYTCISEYEYQLKLVRGNHRLHRGSYEETFRLGMETWAQETKIINMIAKANGEN